jgi:hypothetical protein
MEKVCSLGQMEEYIKEGIRMIKRLDMECSLGKILDL